MQNVNAQELEKQLRLIRAFLNNRFGIKMSSTASMLLRAKLNNKISAMYSDEISRLDNLQSSGEQVTDADIKSAKYLVENFQKGTGKSQLRVEFERLSLKSKEALVSGDTNLDSFHEYLHVPRPIEAEFERVLKEVIPTNRRTLTLIAGNVGDGKSHLLAYEKLNNTDIFSRYRIKIHNDATESFSPTMTAVETLMSKLKGFDGVDDDEEHLIVAINMGILVKFANTARESGKYADLLAFLDESGILRDANATSKITDKYQLITFRDSPSFVFDDKGAHSDFIQDLMAKITSSDDDNPFYSAYLQDKQLAATPELMNYQLLLNKQVQASLESLLINVQIIYGQMLSTRQILNFIHDVVIPPEGTDNYKALLPMLLFSGEKRSSVLKFVARLDPILNQNRSIDRINSQLFSTIEFTSEVKRIFTDLNLEDEFIVNEQTINQIGNSKENVESSSLWGQGTNFVLRLLFLLKHDYVGFVDPVYQEYLEVLAEADGQGAKDKVLAFERMVQRGLVMWNGVAPKKNYSFTNSVDQNVAVEVQVRINNKKGVKRLGTHLLLEARFDGSQTFRQLDIDFQVYRLLTQVVQGFVLRTNDIQSAVDFDHYVQQLLNECQSESVLVRIPETNNFIRIADEGLGYEAETL